MSAKFVVVVDRASDAQLQSVHQILKANASGWWHRFTNTWVVSSDDKTAAYWRDLLTPIVSRPASVLVLKVDQTSWAYRGPDAKERAAWFHQNFRG